MPEPRISPETAARIDALCNRVAVARRLDDDLRRELCGHMEDKLLAYLDGREAVTEADALLLVERHFGQPEAVGDGFRSVYPAAAAATVARRLAAAFALSSALALCSHLVSVVLVGQVYWGRRLESEMPGQWRPGEWMAFVAWVVLPAVSVAALWVVLRTWRRRQTSGGRVWFADWPWWAVTAVAGGALAAEELGWTIRRWSEMQGIDHSRYFAAYNVFEQATTVLAALAWVWWCAAGTRRRIAPLVAGAGGWVGWYVLRVMFEPGRLWAPPSWNVTLDPWADLRSTTYYAGLAGGRMAALAAAAVLIWSLAALIRTRRPPAAT